MPFCIWGVESCVFCPSNDSKKYRDALSPFISQKLISEATAGLLASSSSVILFSPLLVLKTHIQTTALPAGKIFSEILKKDGIRGLWAGAGTGLLQVVPSTVAYMIIFERLKERFAISLPASYDNMIPGIAGGISRSIVVSIISPLDRIRTMQLNGTHGNFLSISKEIYKSDGITGFYKGWSSTILRDAPFSAIYWYSYENFKPRFNNYNLHDILTNFLSGSSAATIATIVTHPFDVMKTKLQTTLSTTTNHIIPKTNLFIDILKVVRTEGAVIGLHTRKGDVILCGQGKNWLDSTIYRIQINNAEKFPGKEICLLHWKLKESLTSRFITPFATKNLGIILFSLNDNFRIEPMEALPDDVAMRFHASQ
eukprot:gene9220-19118_t